MAKAKARFRAMFPWPCLVARIAECFEGLPRRPRAWVTLDAPFSPRVEWAWYVCDMLETALAIPFGLAVKLNGVTKLTSGGAMIHAHVRWWNPAAWVAWFRTIKLGDHQGCAYYRKNWRT